MKRYTYRKEKPREGLFRTWEYDYQHIEAERFDDLSAKSECGFDHLDMVCNGYELFSVTKLVCHTIQ